MPRLSERFREKVDRTGECWLWTASLTSTGYGQIVDGRKHFYAHRLAWEWAHGEAVPEGLCVLHRCDNRRCVNPEHLYVGTKQQNAVDTHSRGRWKWVAPGQGKRRQPPSGKHGPTPTPIATRFWPKVDRAGGDGVCWPWLGQLEHTGYGLFFLPGKKPNAPKARAHRVSWELANGPIPNGLNVLHRCDNRRCVNPAHLFLGTIADNNRDRWEKGREADRRGVKNGRAKLTADQVGEIRTRYAAGGISQERLGLEYGVCQTQISRIIHKQWRHV